MSEQPVNQNPGRSYTSGYMPQLDSLRAFAVGFVLISHWFPKQHKLQFLPFGAFGVILFFVLSGFLISQILFKSRDIAEAQSQNKFHSVKQFYIRRTLRIFPIYYITLIVLFIFNVSSIRDIILWFVLYASNIYFYYVQSWEGTLSHLWTLAVEEQFYIIWPFIILFIPRKHLFKSIIAIILMGPAFRFGMYLLSLSQPGINIFSELLTPANIDNFGLGALLAYINIYKKDDFRYQTKLLMTASMIYVIIMTGIILLKPTYTGVIFRNFNMSLLALFLIAKASSGFTGIMKIILENKILIYLGKISYGLYLYHNFIVLIYESAGLPVIQNLYLRLFIQGSMLVLMASISWYVIEKPINNLKSRFAYN